MKIPIRFVVWVSIPLMFGAAGDAEAQSRLEIAGDGGAPRVSVTADGRTHLRSPAEGLWSIAMDWRDDWPAGWHHAHPDKVEIHGEWTVLTGSMETPAGKWRLSDAFRERDGLIECRRRFEWHGEGPTGPCALSLRFQSPGTGTGVVLPGILYHGNPSGARSGKTPVYTAAPGEEAIYEEHRYPMPFASHEWEADGEWLGAAFHTLPSPVPYGNLPDQWWSMGATALEDGTEFTVLSGPCASNGERAVIKAVQPGFVPYKDAWIDVPPGAVIEKTVYLQAYPVEREGAGFQTPLRSSLDLYTPYSLDGLPSFMEIVEDKHRFALTRWIEKDGFAGFKKYPDRDFLVMGWCGQAASPGYALQILQPFLNDPDIPAMAQKSLDTLTRAEFYESGFHTWCDLGDKTWSRHEPLSQGQAMLNFARAIRAAEKTELDSSKWRAFLEKAARFHAERIMRDDWRPVSTDEAFYIAPLCESSLLFDTPLYLEAAEKAGRHYAGRHLAMREPYWGGTLDASCEDKEGAFAALQGFASLYETTGKREYLDWAEHACGAALTYTVVWDIDMPPGRLRDHGFKTRGWTVVSPQNQHIDVFGVLIAPDIYRVGTHLEREAYKKLALVMYRSCGQLTDPYGSQGEQPQHTNYTQRGRADDVFALRGGYNETWTVFWITAHFLNAAAQFHELGVDLRGEG